MKSLVTITIMSAALLLAGCSTETSSSAPASNETTAAASTNIPGEVFLAEAPANAQPLSEARTTAKAGETITFTGYVGGRVDPFTKDRAIFVVADTDKAPMCDDGCTTYWDSCCTPRNVITANSATVQIVDDSGQALKSDIAGTNGIQPGTKVSIVGKVREANESLLVVDATGIAVAPAAGN